MALPPLVWTKIYSGTASTWTEISDTNLVFRVEPSSDCGGSNSNTQAASATTDITVPAGETLSLNWRVDNTAEIVDSGYDASTVIFDGVIISSLSSISSGLTSCDSELHFDAGIISTTNNTGVPKIYTLQLEYTTGDSAWHSSAVGMEFNITGYTIGTTTTTTVPPIFPPITTTTTPPPTTPPPPIDPPATTTPALTCTPCIPYPPTTTPALTGDPAIPSFTTMTLSPIIIPGTPIPPVFPLSVPFLLTTTTTTTTTTTVVPTTLPPTTVPIDCPTCNKLGY